MTDTVADTEVLVETTLPAPANARPLVVDFAGEIFTIEAPHTFTCGRMGTLELEDNPYLHRDFLEILEEGGLWWVINVGSRLPAVAPTTFTPSQLLCILALAEPILKRVGSGSAQVPTAVEGASRLGWTQPRFNRKLDNVCDKLERAGVSGLRGGRGKQASNRRVVLVEYAVSTLTVTREDLPLLDIEKRANLVLPRPDEDD